MIYDYTHSSYAAISMYTKNRNPDCGRGNKSDLPCTTCQFCKDPKNTDAPDVRPAVGAIRSNDGIISGNGGLHANTTCFLYLYSGHNHYFCKFPTTVPIVLFKAKRFYGLFHYHFI